MRTLWIFCICVIISTTILTPLSAQDIGASHTVSKYFNACQVGDIDTIKLLVTGPFYAKRRSLLNENAGYSDFLIEHFDGVKVSIISETTIDESRHAAVLVERQYPDGSLLRTRFIVVSQDKEMWKIYDEQLVSD